MLDLVDETAHSACAEFVYIVAQVVLVDAFTQSDGFGEAVDFHCPTPGCRAAECLGHLAGPGVQVVCSAVVEGSCDAVAA